MRVTLLTEPHCLVPDAALCERLEVFLPHTGNNSPLFRIGLAGPSGGIYRVVETFGLVETVRVFEALRELGFLRCKREQRSSRDLQCTFRYWPGNEDIGAMSGGCATGVVAARNESAMN
jgi:hypothetical protein